MFNYIKKLFIVTNVIDMRDQLNEVLIRLKNSSNKKDIDVANEIREYLWAFRDYEFNTEKNIYKMNFVLTDKDKYAKEFFKNGTVMDILTSLKENMKSVEKKMRKRYKIFSDFIFSDNENESDDEEFKTVKSIYKLVIKGKYYYYYNPYLEITMIKIPFLKPIIKEIKAKCYFWMDLDESKE